MCAIRTCRFKSCFPHFRSPCKSRAPSFFPLNTLTVPLPAFWPLSLRRIFSSISVVAVSRHVINESLHSLRTCLPHLFRDMAVTIQCESCGKMPHVFLQCLDVISGPQTVHGKRVPQMDLLHFLLLNILLYHLTLLSSFSNFRSVSGKA